MPHLTARTRLDKILEGQCAARAIVAGQSAKDSKCSRPHSAWNGDRRQPLLGVFGALECDLARQLVWRQDSGAKSTQLQAGDERFPVSAECGPARCRRKRAKPKNGCGKCETR